MKRKNIDPRISAVRMCMPWFLTFVLGFFLMGMPSLMAQDTTQVTTEAPVAEEEAEVEEAIKSRMSLSADQYPDGTIALNGLLRARIEGSYQKVPGAKVSFFILNAEGEEVPLGDSLTGPDGVAIKWVNKSNLTLGEDGTYSFLARYDGEDKMDGSESDLILRPARLIMEAQEADSIYTIRLQAVADSPDGPLPIAAAPVALYIKRMFSSLKVAEGETDEEGIMEVEFPAGLSGDQEGILQITAKIEDTEEYGNLAASMDQKWGTTVSYEIEKLPKALWSPHPPLWMMITFFVLMGTVWAHYAIIVIELYLVKSEKKTTP